MAFDDQGDEAARAGPEGAGGDVVGRRETDRVPVERDEALRILAVEADDELIDLHDGVAPCAEPLEIERSDRWFSGRCSAYPG